MSIQADVKTRYHLVMSLPLTLFSWADDIVLTISKTWTDSTQVIFTLLWLNDKIQSVYNFNYQNFNTKTHLMRVQRIIILNFKVKLSVCMDSIRNFIWDLRKFRLENRRFFSKSLHRKMIRLDVTLSLWVSFYLNCVAWCLPHEFSLNSVIWLTIVLVLHNLNTYGKN